MPAEDEAEQGLLRSDHPEGNDRYVASARCEETDARLAPQKGACLTPVPFWEESQDLTTREHAQSGHKSTPVALAATHWEGTGVPDDEPEQRKSKSLDLRHVADREIKVDRDQRRILPVDVIRNEDVWAGLRKVRSAINPNVDQRPDDVADGREQETPQPKTLDRPLGRLIGDHAVCAGRVRIART